MRKVTVVVLLLVVLASVIIPASAMIGGELDTEHTNVGAIVFRWPAHDDKLARICTGTLIHPQVLLTASHCTQPLFANDLVPDKVWVTFEQDALFGSPEQDSGYLAISDIAEHDSHDIALVILSEPVKGTRPEELPSKGYLDGVIHKFQTGKGLVELDLIFVGYGPEYNLDLPENLLVDALRRVGPTSYKNLTSLEIMTENGDSGEAIPCSGDSGGPLFHIDDHGHEIMVGLQSRSGSAEIQCDPLGYAFKYRLDTDSAQDFISKTIETYFSPD